jgi:hypothetical protein
MTKKLTVTTIIMESNSPTNWVFTPECTGVERLALIEIMVNTLKKEKERMLNGK